MKDNTGLLKGYSVFQYFYNSVITVITVYPFLFIVMTSFKPKRSIFRMHGESCPFLPGQFVLVHRRFLLWYFPEQAS